jgi:acyl phosphate:glycerol-3-phosphate acyltransferase
MRLFFAMFIAYLIGSIPTGYLFAKYKNIDLRQHGSGNVGATNVFRAVGKIAALFTLLIDAFKGFVVVTFLAEVLYSFRMNVSYPDYQVVLALCVIAGHNWPIFLSFKGGKGVATSAGVLLALCPKLLLVGFCVWLLVFIFTKIVSISSIISVITISVASYFFDYAGVVRFLAVILAVLAIARHRANIKRLIKKEEKRIIVRI